MSTPEKKSCLRLKQSGWEYSLIYRPMLLLNGDSVEGVVVKLEVDGKIYDNKDLLFTLSDIISKMRIKADGCHLVTFPITTSKNRDTAIATIAIAEGFALLDKGEFIFKRNEQSEWAVHTGRLGLDHSKKHLLVHNWPQRRNP